jgi:hypothetical protein
MGTGEVTEEAKMFKKNGMLPKDTFHDDYKTIEEHKEEIKKKSRKVRECLSNGELCLPEQPENGQTKQV